MSQGGQCSTMCPDRGFQLSDQRDGGLRINDSRFELAAANPERLQALFANGGADTSLHGFAMMRLLAQLHGAMNRVADLSKLAV